MNNILNMRGFGQSLRLGLGDGADDPPAIADQSDQLNPDTTDAPVTPGVNVAPVSSAQVTAMNPSQGSATAAVPENTGTRQTTSNTTTSSNTTSSTSNNAASPDTSGSMALVSSGPSTGTVLLIAAVVLAAGGATYYYMSHKKTTRSVTYTTTRKKNPVSRRHSVNLSRGAAAQRVTLRRVQPGDPVRIGLKGNRQTVRVTEDNVYVVEDPKYGERVLVHASNARDAKRIGLTELGY